MNEHGKIIIKLDDMIKKVGISKNRLSHRAEMQRTQLNNYCKNKVTRIDLNTLAKICEYLNCDVNEILVIEKEM